MDGITENVMFEPWCSSSLVRFQSKNIPGRKNKKGKGCGHDWFDGGREKLEWSEPR